MGYYIKVKDKVKIYVEDLRPECKKAIVFLHGLLPIIIFLNTNLISCPS